MAQRTTFAKLQRERARKARKHEKLAKRQGSDDTPAPEVDDTPSDVPLATERGGPIGPDELLSLVQQLTAAHGAGELTDDEFEEQKLALMDRL